MILGTNASVTVPAITITLGPMSDSDTRINAPLLNAACNSNVQQAKDALTTSMLTLGSEVKA